MAEIVTEQNPDEKAFENFLRLMAEGGTDQQRLAVEGAAAVGYLNQTESLPADLRGLVDDTTNVILRMMTDGDPQVRQTGMELAWSWYTGRRAARHAKDLTLDVLFE